MKNDVFLKMRTFRKIAEKEGKSIDPEGEAADYYDKELQDHEWTQEEKSKARDSLLEHLSCYNEETYDEALNDCIELLWENMSKPDKKKILTGLIGNKYELLPMLEEEDFIIEWSSRYYDGILSGMMTIRNPKSLELDDGVRMAWFDCAAGDEVPIRFRAFLVYQLTREQLDEEIYWHQLFLDKVGNNCTYYHDEHGNPRKKRAKIT